MRLELVAFGKSMPAWVDEGFKDYASRLPKEWKLTLTELPLERRGKNSDQKRIDRREAQRMRHAIRSGARTIALAVEGKHWSTEQLADKLDQWRSDHQQLVFLVGGPDGLPGQVQAAADEVWSLSPLTLPHPLVRVVVAEQLYRAWSILNGLPYHRGS